ncbi:MAG: hypothetical protein K6E50_15445 [Lachnospiraceae bacterium]|nr:hypothetical protein [Lachnospiraceae bacterium]
MDDIHSKWWGYFYLTGPVDYTAISPARSNLSANIERMEKTRSKYYPDEVPGYEEVGNTAYITFDSFALTMASAEDFYKVEDPMGMSNSFLFAKIRRFLLFLYNTWIITKNATGFLNFLENFRSNTYTLVSGHKTGFPDFSQHSERTTPL